MRHEKKYLKLLELISLNIKKHRAHSGLTQEEVAELTGFNVRYYQRLEAGAQSPNLLTLYKVSEGFKIEVSDLLKNRPAR